MSSGLRATARARFPHQKPLYANFFRLLAPYMATRFPESDRAKLAITRDPSICKFFKTSSALPGYPFFLKIRATASFRNVNKNLSGKLDKIKILCYNIKKRLFLTASETLTAFIKRK